MSRFSPFSAILMRPRSHFAATPVSILRHMETPFSKSSVTLNLELIQKRCEELRDEPEGLLELSLEEPVTEPDASDPYNRKTP